MVRKANPLPDPTALEQLLLNVIARVKEGDFSARMPLDWTGVPGKVAIDYKTTFALQEEIVEVPIEAPTEEGVLNFEGVVRDVIREVLDKEGPMKKDEVIKHVKKARFVKDFGLPVYDAGIVPDGDYPRFLAGRLGDDHPALAPGALAATNPARLGWLVLDGLGLAPCLLLFRAIELPALGLISVQVAYLVAVGVIGEPVGQQLRFGNELQDEPLPVAHCKAAGRTGQCQDGPAPGAQVHHRDCGAACREFPGVISAFQHFTRSSRSMNQAPGSGS